MNGQEIKELIARNDSVIQKNMKVGTFILNKTIKMAIEENELLRKICPHEYDENGICIYCGSEKE